jgi:hypothetical protein
MCESHHLRETAGAMTHVEKMRFQAAMKVLSGKTNAPHVHPMREPPRLLTS